MHGKYARRYYYDLNASRERKVLVARTYTCIIHRHRPVWPVACAHTTHAHSSPRPSQADHHMRPSVDGLAGS